MPQANPSGLDRLFERLRKAVSAEELQRLAVEILGPYSFSAGVIAGMGLDILDNAAELLKLARTLVLADLHDLRTG